MNVKVELDNSCPDYWVPEVSEMEKWLQVAGSRLDNAKPRVSLSVRVVDRTESAALNYRYRGVDKPTNILSFGCRIPDAILGTLTLKPVGDLAICAPLVDEEAEQQGKTREAHWAHLLTHGFLHLHGFQHDEASSAEEMESLETAVLATLGYPDPYLSA